MIPKMNKQTYAMLVLGKLCEQKIAELRQISLINENRTKTCVTSK